MKNSHDDENTVCLRRNIALEHETNNDDDNKDDGAAIKHKYTMENGSVKCIKFESIYQY